MPKNNLTVESIGLTVIYTVVIVIIVLAFFGCTRYEPTTRTTSASDRKGATAAADMNTTKPPFDTDLSSHPLKDSSGTFEA